MTPERDKVTVVLNLVVDYAAIYAYVYANDLT